MNPLMSQYQFMCGSAVTDGLYIIGFVLKEDVTKIEADFRYS